MSETLMSSAKIRRVNNHFTPLALLVVLPALFLASIPKFALIASAILITYSTALNYVSAYLVEEKLRLIGPLRVVSNYVVNIGLLD